jgi:DNA processing protein
LLERLLEHGAAISEMPFGWEARGRDFPRRNRIVAGLSRGIVVVEAARRSGSLITASFAAEQGREIFAVPGSPLDPRAEGPNDLLRDGATFCTKAEDVLEALAKQNLSPDAERFGFAEPDVSTKSYLPLWDELDLPELAGAPPIPPMIEDGAAMLNEAAMLSEMEPVGRDFTPPLEASASRTREEVAKCIVDLLGRAPVSIDQLIRESEAPAREVSIILFELESAGRIERHGGGLVSLI